MQSPWYNKIAAIPGNKKPVSCYNSRVVFRHCEQQSCEAIQWPFKKGHWIATPEARNDGLPCDSDTIPFVLL